MGMMDRDWYREHWKQRTAGESKPKPEASPAPAQPQPQPQPLPERGPIYVSRRGTASRSIDSDPALFAVYRQRQQNAATWRRIWLRVGALVVGLALGVLLWRLRR
jgi:hypothetical protein